MVAGDHGSDSRTTTLLDPRWRPGCPRRVGRLRADAAAVMRVVRGPASPGPRSRVRCRRNRLGEPFATTSNRHLVAALDARGRTASFSDPHPRLGRVELDDAGVTVLAGGIAIPGEPHRGSDDNSLCRAAAGIETEAWRYPQAAFRRRPYPFRIATASTEFHTESGRSRWSPARQPVKHRLRGRARSAEWLQGLDDAALAAEIERRSRSILGRITVSPGRGGTLFQRCDGNRVRSSAPAGSPWSERPPMCCRRSAPRPRPA